MARAFQAMGGTTPQEVAQALLRQEQQDTNLARARIESMMQFLTETENELGRFTR